MSHDLQSIWGAFLARPDQENFDPVYEQTKALVWTLCRRILQNEEDARDAFQAAYARLFEDLGRAQETNLGNAPASWAG